MKLYVPKKGSALVIALVFAFCMFIMLGAMLFRQSSTASSNKISLLDKQAYFAARSAMQHFLLKAKLFPTELYDAVEISQGKNPLFNFAEFESKNENGEDIFQELIGYPNIFVVKGESELDSNNKPRYFYLKLPKKDSFIRLASYNNPDYRFIAPGLAEEKLELKFTSPKDPEALFNCNADKYLSYYCRDCTNQIVGDVVLQPKLEIKKSVKITNPNKFDIAKEDGYPYTLGYSVKDVNVKAIDEMKKYGEEAIEITVVGEVVDFQNKECSQLQTNTQKITRRGRI